MANYKTKYKIGDKLYRANRHGVYEFEVDSVVIRKGGTSYADKYKFGHDFYFLINPPTTGESDLYKDKEKATAAHELAKHEYECEQSEWQREGDKERVVELKKELIEVEARLAESK